MNIASAFRLAKNISKLSTHRRCHVGSVLVVNGTPISVGTNRGKSDPHAPYTGLHAEMVCINNAKKTNIQNGIIFVYREKKNGKTGLAKPCKNCEAVLRNKGIKKVIYTTNEEIDFPFFDIINYKKIDDFKNNGY